MVLMVIKVGSPFSWNTLEFLERYFRHCPMRKMLILKVRDII